MNRGAIGSSVVVVGLAVSFAVPSQTPEAAAAPDTNQATELPVVDKLATYELQTLQVPKLAAPAPTSVKVSLGGQEQTLELKPYSLRSEDFRVLIQRDASGELEEVQAPPIVTYRGVVAGVDDSVVVASIARGQVHASIHIDDTLWYVQPFNELIGISTLDRKHVVYRSEDLGTVPDFCGVDHINQPLIEAGEHGGQQAGGGIAGTGLETVEVACDSDWEFFLANSSNVEFTVNDIETVLNNAEFVYERDVDITFELTTIVVRTTNTDPYFTFDAFGILCEFRTAWNSSPESGIKRDVAQMFTGKNMIGTTVGIAWLGVVCNLNGTDCGVFNNLAYGVVESRFNLLTDFRAALSAHEMGHNWLAFHCDGQNDCHIMCSNLGACGGVFGDNLKFGVTPTNQIIAFRNNANCLFEQPPPLLPPFFDDFEILDNDKWIWNDGAFVTSTGENEPSGIRSLNLDGSSGQYDKDEIRSNFIDLSDVDEAEVSYWTEHRGVEDGELLIVEYWSSSGNWEEIETHVSDGNDQDNFVFHSHDLPFSARHDEFRMRFRTDVDSTNDDWFIDDVLVRELPPCAGDVSDDGVVNTTDLLLVLGNWGECPGCAADVDGDGDVNTIDLLLLLGAWGPCP